MRTWISLLVILLVAAIASVSSGCLPLLTGHKQVEYWKDQGTRRLGDIHRVALSNCYDWRTRTFALYAINAIQDASSIPVLFSLAQTKGHWYRAIDYRERNAVENFRTEVLVALGGYGDRLHKEPCGISNPGLIDHAIWLASSQIRPKWDKREVQDPQKIISDLGAITSKPVGIHQLGKVTSYIFELGCARETRARHVLRSIIREESHGSLIRELAVRALGLVGTAEDADFLETFVFDPSLDVRQEVIIALGEIGNTDSIPALKKVLRRNHEAPKNKALASEAIQKIEAGS